MGGSLGKATDGDASSDLAQSPIGIVVGITVVAAILVLVLVGGIVYIKKRNRENIYTPAWRNLFAKRPPPSLNNDGSVVCVSESKDIDQIQLEIRRTPSQPDVVLHSPLLGKAAVDKCRSPLDIRRNKEVITPRTPPMKTKPMAGAATPAPGNRPPSTAMTVLNPNNNPDSVQNQAWESMLHHQAMEIEDPEAEKQKEAGEMEPMIDNLPPPPAFLLDQVNRNSTAPDSDALSYHDILDGYHSEENIDDDDHYNDDTDPGDNPQAPSVLS